MAGRHEQDFSKRSSEPGDNKPFSASKGWLHRFRDGFELKQVTGEAESVIRKHCHVSSGVLEVD